MDPPLGHLPALRHLTVEPRLQTVQVLVLRGGANHGELSLIQTKMTDVFVFVCSETSCLITVSVLSEGLNAQLSDGYLLGIFLFLLVLLSVVQFVIRDHTVVLVPALETKGMFSFSHVRLQSIRFIGLYLHESNWRINIQSVGGSNPTRVLGQNTYLYL